jgi:hypothetical protein
MVEPDPTGLASLKKEGEAQGVSVYREKTM